MDLGLRGQCAVVAGSARGIGLAIVAEAARDAFEVELISPVTPSGGTAITLRVPRS